MTAAPTTSTRAEIEAELRAHHELLAATPDRGFDSGKARASVLADIDALLELLHETLD